jgi:hypothetical protein
LARTTHGFPNELPVGDPVPSFFAVDQGTFRYRVAAVPARPAVDQRSDVATTARPADDGWELVRSRQTKDGVSTLLLYRRPA